MSDCFDHEADAYAQFDDWLTGGSGDEPGPYRYHPRPIKAKVCRACGQGNLRWGQVKGSGWRLFYGNHEHICGEIGATSLIRNMLHAT